MRLWICLPILCGLSAGLVRAEDLPAERPALPPPAEKKVDFATEIRPLLAQTCWKCHGAEKQLSGLRLDRKEEAFLGGDNGAPFEAGKSAESLLIEYVAGVDPERIMPPKGDRLTAVQVGLLRAWIDQGAVWPDGIDEIAVKPVTTHWSFQPVVRPTPPAVQRAGWVRNPIDNFILAKLESLGIEPSPEANRAVLIRRLSLDLLGLPPRPEEVEEFVRDQRPDAYEQLVERLLASPHFGERWGRHWLDLARYADSDGYEKDTPRPFAYRYRDWVIDAVNRDLPFNQFAIEQIAGDLLPDATLEHRLATGFHRNTLTNREGGVDQEEFRVAATVDRVNTTGTIFMGLTVGCAQCHTHKYDPITQREYYQLFAFYNSIAETDISAPTAPEAAAYAEQKTKFDAAHAPLVAELQRFEQEEIPARQTAWEQTVELKEATWTVIEPTELTATNEVTLTRQEDGSYLASGANPDVATYTVTAKTPLRKITGLRLEVLPDPSLPAQGPGRVAHGNFVLSELSLLTGPADGATPPKPVALQNATADFEQGEGAKPLFTAAAALDSNQKTGWAIAPQYAKSHVAVFETATDIDFEPGAVLTVKLDQQYGGNHTIGRFRISLTTAARPIRTNEIPDAVPAILAIAAVDRTPEQRQQLTTYYKTVDADFLKRRQVVEEHLKQAPPAPATKAQAIAELPKPRETHVHLRGDFLQKGAPTQPGVPAVLPELTAAGAQPTRLDFAKWVVDPSQPLTPRVTANRWWQYLFARGLVKTPEDFGIRGEPPSHPELLDWLASELIARNWSRKEFIRLVVTSATYRQSSRARPDLNEIDPKNLWLARQNRYRLEAETVRDVTLAASGLLVPQIGGPSIRPPLPAGVAELGYAGSVSWAESKGADKYRRGLYIFFQRTVPYPMLMTFDSPDSNVTCVRRERSNTPLQALTLLNDPVFVECAQSLGNRVAAEHPQSASDLVRAAFRTTLSREPTAAEAARLQQLYQELHELAATDPAAAAKLAGPQRSEKVEPATAATAVALSRILLNLDEFLVRE